MGPSAAKELAGHALDDAGQLSPPCREALLRAVACAIVKSEDLHPNLAALLVEVARHIGEVPEGLELDDSARFLQLLRQLSSEERTRVLRVLGIAAVLDGRLSRKEKRLLAEAFELHGKKPDFDALTALRRAFVRGDKLDPGLVRALA
jgi:hypothetical protein